jgi:hypothetical protein
VLDCIASFLFSFLSFREKKRREHRGKGECNRRDTEEGRREGKEKSLLPTFFVSRVISSTLRMEAIRSSETS